MTRVRKGLACLRRANFSPRNGLPGGGRGLLALVPALLMLAAACAHFPESPEGWNPEAYAPITFEQLQAPRAAGLTAGQKVAVEGYFWQYLIYDPAIVAYYLTLVGNPPSWYQVRWAAFYRTPQMQGYYDRLALDNNQKRDFRLHRLDHLRVYGELDSLSLGVLYLRVHHVDKLDQAEPLKPPVEPPTGEEIPAAEP